MKSYRTLIAFPLLFASLVAMADIEHVDMGGPRIDFVYDFVDNYAEATLHNASSTSVSSQERCDGVELPGIFLHPVGSGDTVAAYSAEVPEKTPKEGRQILALSSYPFLLFHLGIRDGIDWTSERPNKPNGVRFSVHVDGETVFEEMVQGSGWRPRAVDLTPWGGKTVSIEFCTNAIDGNTNYDWAVFGRPLLARVRGASEISEGWGPWNGLALAQIHSAGTGPVSLTLGERRVDATLPAGSVWLPIEFDRPAPVEFAGDGRLEQVLYAPYESGVTLRSTGLSTPLLTRGRPFNVVSQFVNEGLGRERQEHDATLALAAPGGGEVQLLLREERPRLEPGEKCAVTWRGIQATQSGEWKVNGKPVHVFGSDGFDRDLPAAGNAKSRVRLLAEADGAAYGILETWNGDRWQRAGSLYPLAELETPQGVGQIRVLEVKEEEGNLIVTGDFEQIPGARAVLCFAPDSEAARIGMSSSLTCDTPLEVRAFRGPVVLAGDRAFGAKKDFAVFPGLEYLEGSEASSSERDLAYPLSDRHVPALHKLCAPLMAVQGRNMLVALIWDIDQPWAAGECYPAARFDAPDPELGYEHCRMELFVPSVGKYVAENDYAAQNPFPLPAGETLHIESTLVLDHAANYSEDSIVHGPHRGGLLLQAYRHYFDLFGLPAPSPAPRDWEAEKALSLDAYFHAVWGEDPPGWAHCFQWQPGLLVGHAVPQFLIARDGASPETVAAIEEHTNRVLSRALEERGGSYLWSNAGCHILMGELPFYYGFVGPSMADFLETGKAALARREDGLWRWHPAHDEPRYQALGKDGDHTLSQAALPLMIALRAARMTGDRALREEALELVGLMEAYEVPRGAQTWECPLYQPDILAAAQAIRAYCEAYRLTGDKTRLDHARYWAWTGLPFLYLWEMDGYPTMRYNVISVIGSTFYTHSWLGLPVVWCGLVYAYALQDFAEFDDSFDWNRIAEGITRSAMAQQYAEGPNAGTYPDSWNMVKNSPNSADINPENILVNAFRLRGSSPEIRYRAVEGPDGSVVLNTNADVASLEGGPATGRLLFQLCGAPGFATHTLLAPVPRPTTVNGNAETANSSRALFDSVSGWRYDGNLQAVIVKCAMQNGQETIDIQW